MYALPRRGRRPWTARSVSRPQNTFDFEVGIDDAGRVLLVGGPGGLAQGKHDGVWAIRRNRAGAWGRCGS